jgi:hypothetical protein
MISDQLAAFCISSMMSNVFVPFCRATCQCSRIHFDRSIYHFKKPGLLINRSPRKKTLSLSGAERKRGIKKGRCRCIVFFPYIGYSYLCDSLKDPILYFGGDLPCSIFIKIFKTLLAA